MKPMVDRAGWILACAPALAAIAFAAREVASGPLDPPGSPSSTMQTLDNIPPAWDRQLISTDGLGSGCESSRFKCVMLKVTCTPDCFFTYEGVVDLETGLVWARDATAVGNTHTWPDAVDACLGYGGGDRTGWRLPTAAELASILDTTRVNPDPSIPQSSPFLHVTDGSAQYWTATEDAEFPVSNAYSVYFLGPEAGLPGGVFAAGKSATLGAWCVRGADTQ